MLKAWLGEVSRGHKTVRNRHMQPHVIRLRGPWEYEFVSVAGGGVLPRGTMQLPGDWPPGTAGLAGDVYLTRHFHRPTGLSESERIWLTIVNQKAAVGVTLNGQPLLTRETAKSEKAAAASEPVLRLEITSLLQPRNTLNLELFKPTEDARFSGQVALEIESTGA